MQGGYLILGCAVAVLILGIVLLARRSEVFALLMTVMLFLLAVAAWFAQGTVAPVTLLQLLETHGEPFFWAVTSLPMVIALVLLERFRRRTATERDETETELWYLLVVPLLEVLIGAYLLPVIVSPLVDWLGPFALDMPGFATEARGRVTFFIAGMAVCFMIALIFLPLHGPFQTAATIYVAVTCFILVFSFGVPIAMLVTVGAHLVAKTAGRQHEPVGTRATAS